MIIDTPRSHLRPLTDADMEGYLAMAADPEVTRYVWPSPISRADAQAAATHYRALLETKGYGYWAIEVNRGASFAGIILLRDVNSPVRSHPRSKSIGFYRANIGAMVTRPKAGVPRSITPGPS